MDLWMEWEEGEGGVNWESGTDMHVPPRVTRTTSERLLHSTQGSVWCCLMTERDEVGAVGGRLEMEAYMYTQN